MDELLKVAEKIESWCKLQALLECFNPEWRKELQDAIKQAKDK